MGEEQRGLEDEREGKRLLLPPQPPTQGETLFSPPFTAAVPAMGARLAPLWGGHILLAVLGGGGRASPFANLDGEEETKTHSRTAPEPVLPCRSHKPQSCPGQDPGSLVPSSALSQGLPEPVSQALKLPGQWFHSRAA